MSTGRFARRWKQMAFEFCTQRAGPERLHVVFAAIEQLEDRTVPAIAVPNFMLSGGGGGSVPDGGSSPGGAYTPAQIAHAYGIDATMYGSIQQQGAGQTIAIIDAYDNPGFVSSSSSNFNQSDLHRFDEQFGLPEPTGFFTKVDQNGGTNYPAANSGWTLEIALDVEWTHALAPLANIILVEGKTANTNDLFGGAVKWAVNSSPATVVTMSFGVPGGFSGEDYYDSYFESPAGKGVTFFASTGDSSAPAGYPAESDNVVAVGGTSLHLNSNNTYGSETVWGDGKAGDEGGGGGISQYEAAPAFQSGLVVHSGSSTVNQNGFRATPDVSFDADPYTGVAVLDSYDGGSSTPWFQVGGTSVSSPCWAAIMAITDEIRADQGLGSLDGATQTLPALYNLYDNPGEYAADFHDIVSGSNGYSAATGYDLGTGIGTPIVSALAPQLAQGITAGLTASVDSSGNFVVSDILGDTDSIRVGVSGSNYTITDSTQAFIPDLVPAGTTLSNEDQTLTVPFGLSGFTAALEFELGGGNNSLTVDESGGSFPNAIVDSGTSGTTNDLALTGSGTQSATYTPSGSTQGSGSIASSGGSITFANVAGLDLANLAAAKMTYPSANDVVTIANGFDYASGGTNPALDTTGTSGGVAFAPAAFWNDASVAIDTTAVAGVDSVAISSANDANGIANFSVTEPIAAGGTIAATGPIAFAGSVSLTATSASSTSAGTIATGTGLTVDVSGSTSVLAGSISGAGGFTSEGSGTIDLSGSNTSTGATLDSGSELIVDGTIVSSTSVASGSILTGAGGTIAAAVADSGTLTAGDTASPTGLLTIGGLSFGTGAKVAIALDGTAPGTGYDRLISTSSGTISLANATLSLTLGSGFAPSLGTAFDILVNNTGSPISGSFVGLPEGSTIASGGQLFRITYRGGASGGDVVLTAVTATSTTLADQGLSPATAGGSIEQGYGITFAASVAAPVGIATGTIQLEDVANGNALVGPVETLANGSATFTVAATAANGLAVGTHQLIAVYVPSGNFASSQSAAVGQVVDAAFGVQTVGTTGTSNFVQTATGFAATFNAPVNPALLDDNAPTGGVSFALSGASGVGAVTGSVVFDAADTQATFVATGTFVSANGVDTPKAGILSPGVAYTADLSGTDSYAIQDTDGHVLGSSTASGGSDYRSTFTAATSSSAYTVSAPYFARGYSQSVDVPGNATTGFPLSISVPAGAAAVTTATFDLQYNPALLAVSGGTIVASGFSGSVTVVSPGLVAVTLSGGTLAAGTVAAVAEIQASVPSTALLKDKEVLNIANISIDGGTSDAQDGSAVHVAAFAGDAAFNQHYDAQDAFLIEQFALGNAATAAPFGANYKLLDPTIIADVNSDGSVNAQDAFNVNQQGLGNATTPANVIPALPTGPSPGVGGPDPKLSIGDYTGTPGSTVTVAVDLSVLANDPAFLYDSGDLAIAFDPKVLQASNIRAGTLFSAGSVSVGWAINEVAGTIRIQEYWNGSNPPTFKPGTSGAVVLIDFTIASTAKPGTTTPLNLAKKVGTETTDLNGGNATLSPAPTNFSNDSTDGKITIVFSTGRLSKATVARPSLAAATIAGEMQQSAAVLLSTGGSSGALVNDTPKSRMTNADPTSKSKVERVGSKAPGSGTLKSTSTETDSALFATATPTNDLADATSLDSSAIELEAK